MNRKVFLSYASEDQEFVESEIIRHLRIWQIPYFFAPESLVPAEEWEIKLYEGLESCAWFFVVVSDHSLKSYWVRKEVEWAIKNRWSRIAVIVLNGGEVGQLDPKLSAVQHVDYRPGLETGHTGLIKVVEQILAVPIDDTTLDAPIWLTVLGAKGGVGKSTIASRMAELIAESRHNALLVDLDTGATGLTNLYKARQVLTGDCIYMIDLLKALARDEQLDLSNQKLVEDVTPAYLRPRNNYGSVLLLPAQAINVTEPVNTGDLLYQIRKRFSEGRSEDEGRILAAKAINDAIQQLVDATGKKIHCVIVDCGAEGPDFHYATPETCRRSLITFMVTQPNAELVANINRLSRTIRNQLGSENTRLRTEIVINGSTSPEVGKQATNRYTSDNYTVAGTIPFDPEYFIAVQEGRINQTNANNPISRAVREVLNRISVANDKAEALVPKEEDLWIPSAARMIVQKGADILLTGDLSKAWLGAAVLGLFIAILVGIFGIFQLQDIDYSLTLVTDNPILRQSLNNSRTIYVVLIFVAIVVVCGVFMYFYSKRDQLGVWSKLRSLRTKNDAESEIREYLHKLERNPKANSIVTWLRNIIR